MNLAVVLVGYNRPASMKRLYESVTRSSGVTSVDIVVSIDYSEHQDDVRRVVVESCKAARDVKFRCFSERQGLRNHILACGDLTEVYDAVVVLEDDIVVSDSFLEYVLSAIQYVDSDASVAGISLYSPTNNEMSLLPFSPKPTGFDNYYLQSAQSWGQCWTRFMWQRFREWYDLNDGPLVNAGDMPSRIYSWPESSWKKYYMKYLIETEQTFFYPSISFSTNYSDVGQHNKVVSPRYQVPLVTNKKEFNFGAQSEVPLYDVFFERKGLFFDNERVCCDFYGTKIFSDSRFLLSSRKLNLPIVESYGLTYRPQEDNYIYRSDGNDIFLYDLGDNLGVEFNEYYMNFKLANYHSNLGWRHSLIYGMVTLKARLIQKLKRL